MATFGSMKGYGLEGRKEFRDVSDSNRLRLTSMSCCCWPGSLNEGTLKGSLRGEIERYFD